VPALQFTSRLSNQKTCSWRITLVHIRMATSIFSLFNLLLAISLLLSLASALPLQDRMSDVSVHQQAESHTVPRYNGPGRAHPRWFPKASARSLVRKARTTQKETQDTKKVRTPRMENSLRGKTKVYSGNYWGRKVYHV
jgi:hypothetical protein